MTLSFKTLADIMLAKKKNTAQLDFFSTFRDQLSKKHPLFVLAGQIDWQSFEDAFAQASRY